MLRWFIVICLLVTGFAIAVGQNTLTIPVPRVLQSNGAVLMATSPSVSAKLSNIVGQRVIGVATKREPADTADQRVLLGFFIPIDILLGVEDDDPVAPTVSDAGSLWIWPNPFKESVWMRMKRGEFDAATGEIYSLDGGLVASLPAPLVTESSIEFAWDGNDFSAEPSASGIYTIYIVASNSVTGQRTSFAASISRVR
jgi:hypothetical protein